MKLMISLLASLALMLTVVSEANAKRFGGGGFGKSFSSSPYKKSAPKKAPQQAGKPTDSANAAAPAAGRRGMMGGMMGGLLAGGLFAYLLGSGAFEGIQFMDILLLAGLAFVAFKIFSGMAAAKQARPVYGDISASGRQVGEQGQRRENLHPHVGSSATNHTPNIMDRTDDESIPMDLPAGFDVPSFIDGALGHYRLIQQAWNDGDMSVIEEYVATDLFQALAEQRQSVKTAPQTEVLDLTVDIVRADASGPVHEISLLFRGRCADKVEKSEDGIFDTWHLARDTRTADAPWIIVGIEAE